MKSIYVKVEPDGKGAVNILTVKVDKNKSNASVIRGLLENGYVYAGKKE